MARPRTLLLIGTLIAWLGELLVWLLLQPVDTPLDHDEIYWVGSAYYYDLAFVQRDWTHPAWLLLPARENPPVSKYVIGLGLAAAGHRITTIDSLSYFYLFWLQWENNADAHVTGPDGEKRARVVEAATPGFRQRVLEKRRAPLTRPVVRAARNTVLVCAFLASLLLFMLATIAGDRMASLLASQLLLLHPAVVYASSHAMSDAIALMFSIAAALAAFWWYRRFSQLSQADLISSPSPGSLGEFALPPDEDTAGVALPRRQGVQFSQGLSSSITSGVLLALACGAKMNSLVIVVLTGVMVASVTMQRWMARERAGAITAVAHGLIILLVALSVFVVINPAILQDLPGGLAATVMEHRRTEQLQTDLAHPTLVSLPAKLEAVISMGFFGWPPFAAMVLIVVWSAVRRRHDDGIRFAVCWWLVAFICVTLWIPFMWSRYIIPLLPPSVWLVGCFSSAGARWLIRAFRQGLSLGQDSLTTDEH